MFFLTPQTLSLEDLRTNLIVNIISFGLNLIFCRSGCSFMFLKIILSQDWAFVACYISFFSYFDRCCICHLWVVFISNSARDNAKNTFWTCLRLILCLNCSCFVVHKLDKILPSFVSWLFRFTACKQFHSTTVEPPYQGIAKRFWLIGAAYSPPVASGRCYMT